MELQQKPKVLDRLISNFLRVGQRIGEIKKVGDSLGINLKPSDCLWLHLDEKICGETQVPALEWLKVGYSKNRVMKLSILRTAITSIIAGKMLASASSVKGLAVGTNEGILQAAGSTLIRTGMSLSELILKNVSGSLERTAWVWLMNEIGENGVNIINDVLQENGFSTSEIGDVVTTFADNLYWQELRVTQAKSVVDDIGLPLIIGGVLASSGQEGYGIATAIIGLMSSPIGMKAYRESDLIRKFSFRLAQSAKAIPYQEELNCEHIQMTTGLNLISEVPNIMSAGLLLSKYLGWIKDIQQVFSGYVGFSYGLVGLSAALTRQRDRNGDTHTSEMVKKVFDFSLNGEWILTERKWKKHIDFHEVKPSDYSVKNGLVVHNLSSVGMAEPLSFEAEKGETILLKSDSGIGKSTVMTAIAQYLEHSGFAGIVKNGILTSLHDMPLSEVRNLFQIELERGIGNVNVLEYLQSLFIKSEEGRSFIEKGGFEKLSVKKREAVLKGKDVYLKAIIDGKKWKKNDLEEAKKFYEKRREWITQLLKDWNPFPENPAINIDFRCRKLSEGQIQRLINMRALMEASLGKKEVVMLDEPYGRLDKKMALDWIKRVNDFIKSSNLIAIMTTHHYVKDEESKEKISHEQIENALKGIVGTSLKIVQLKSKIKR